MSNSPGSWLDALTGLAVGLLLAGCVSTPSQGEPPDSKHPLAEGTPLCGRPDLQQLFPHALRSQTLPVLVHYHKEAERETARQVLAFVEKGWDFHVNQLGMRPALTDHGECGPDSALDVFVWKGHRSCQVNVLSGDPSTPWDDRRVYMVVDPWGPYGGPELEETVVHEMAHASQAADDWFEAPHTFEMSAVFADQVYANRYIKTYFNDFQAHPDWALDRNDKYETWYMYGSSLYLLYLKDRFFGGEARFLSRLWLESRSPPGAEQDPRLNEPDFADVIDSLLEEHHSSYVDTVPEFARWRWYTGEHVDERHFRHFQHGREHLEAARLALASQVEARPGTLHIRERAPMMLGTSYIELTAGPGTPQTLYVSLQAEPHPGLRFVVQAVPGLTGDSDGERLELSSGPQPLRFGAHPSRTLIVTALPTGPYDPDLRGEERHPFSLLLSDRP